MSYTTSVTLNSRTSTLYDYKVVARQSDLSHRPRKPLPYHRVNLSAPGHWCLSNFEAKFYGGSGPDLPEGPLMSQLEFGPPYVLAFDRFQQQLGERAEMLQNLVEVERSLAMIARRTNQLISFVSALKRGNIGAAYDSLDINRSKKKIPKGFSNLWLETSFGWKPLINDIGNSVGILQREFDISRVRGSSKKTLVISVDNSGIQPDGSMHTETQNATYRGFVKISGNVEVSNPNMYLANQMGFVNPTKVLWDLVPFSFVIDWFIPINKFLSSFSNEYGLNVTNKCCSFGATGSGYFHIDNSGDHSIFEAGSAAGYCFIRKLNVPNPSLISRCRVPSPSLWLALTSTSLLIQRFKHAV